MKFKFLIYCLPFLFFLATSSCVNELLLNDGSSQNNHPDLEPDEYLFNVRVVDGQTRTRNIDFNPQTALRLNRVWMGVFSIETGKKVAQNTMALDYRTIRAGEISQGLIRMKLDAPEEESELGYIIVCLANILDVKDHNKNDLEETLLNDVTNWREFNDIAIDFESAYTYPHDTNIPVLVGFMSDRGKPSDSHVKVDQFAESEDDKNGNNKDKGYRIRLSSPEVKNYVVMAYDKELNNYVLAKINTINGEETIEATKTSIIDGALINLRRIVANINVNIKNENNNLEISEVSYKRYNMPGHVYIIERRTTDCEFNEAGQIIIPGSFPTDASLSPNSCDSDTTAYISDSNWIPGNPDGFSFQHFANKHWARNIKGPELLCHREDINEDHQSFKALVNSGTNIGDNTDFNNYASFFIIKMHILDKTTGRAVEALYTIHEGNTSDELGNAVDLYDESGNIVDEKGEKKDEGGNPILPKGNPVDFVCARNINYTYNVTVKGIDQIYHNVVQGGSFGSNIADHGAGQGGKIWEMKYMNNYNSDGTLKSSERDNLCSYDYNTGSFPNAVGNDGGIFWNAITIENDTPDLAFRLYGYNTDTDVKHIEGYNYNFPDQSFQWLKGLWPESAGHYSHYFKDYEELVNPQGHGTKDIPDNILNGLKIIPEDYLNVNATKEEIKKVIEDPDKAWNIKEFIFNHKNNSNDSFKGKKYHVWIDKSNITDKKFLDRNNYIRSIYIADRNGTKDTDECTTLVNIYAVAQYPDDLSGQSFDFILAQAEDGSSHIDANGGTVTIDPGLEEKDFDFSVSGRGMLFSDNPDREVAFRILGYDENNKYVDICYNFDLDDYPEFNSYWPAKNLLVTQSTTDLTSIDTSLLDGLKIRSDGKEMTIKDYLSASTPQSSPAGFFAEPYNKNMIGDPRNYMRALYVFDKNAFKTNYLKSINNLVHYQIYGVEQYPNEASKTPITLPTGLPTFNKSKTLILDPVPDYVIELPLPSAKAFDGSRLSNGDYYYRLTINNLDYSYYGKVIDNKYVFNIPDLIVQTGGDIVVQIISNHPYFSDSGTQKIGSINLTSPADALATDWTNAVNWFKTSSNQYKNFNGSYLKGNTYIDPAESKNNRGFTVSSTYLVSGGAKAYLSFNVYSACRIRVNAYHGSERQIKMQLNNRDFITSSNIPTSYDKDWYYEFVITIDDLKDGANLINLVPNGGGLTFVSVTVIPY